MKFLQGNNRSQIALFPVSLDDAIDQENEVRLIDLFVDSLQLRSSDLKSNSLKMADRHTALST